MSINVDGQPVYHVLRPDNGRDIGYIKHGTKEIFTFYKEGPEYTCDKTYWKSDYWTFYQGLPPTEYQYTLPDKTLNNWIGAGFMKVNNNVGRSILIYFEHNEMFPMCLVNSSGVISQDVKWIGSSAKSVWLLPTGTTYFGLHPKTATSPQTREVYMRYNDALTPTYGTSETSGKYVTKFFVTNPNPIPLRIVIGGSEEYWTGTITELGTAAANTTTRFTTSFDITKGVSIGNNKYRFRFNYYYTLPGTSEEVHDYDDTMEITYKPSGGGGSGGNPCLKKDTIITMSDGTKKPIQYIRTGDEILGFDFENNTTTTTVVLYATEIQKQQQAHYIMFDNGKVLCTTRGHDLYVVEYGRYIPAEDIKEGQHCLDEDGNEVEVLAIHWDIELKTYEPFYHLVSSNNTYFANGIMNASAPIDKYRYIHDLCHFVVSDEVMNIIMDESKDAACFNFTVTDPEFIQKGTPFQSKIKKARNRIWELETLIKDTDKDVAKVNSGIPVGYDVMALRVKYYEEIEQLQNQMKDWESEYNKLLVEYSDIGEDILLIDQERRKKYFRRANKIANDNLEVYKKHYTHETSFIDQDEYDDVFYPRLVEAE